MAKSEDKLDKLDSFDLEKMVEKLNDEKRTLLGEIHSSRGVLESLKSGCKDSQDELESTRKSLKESKLQLDSVLNALESSNKEISEKSLRLSKLNSDYLVQLGEMNSKNQELDKRRHELEEKLIQKLKDADDLAEQLKKSIYQEEVKLHEIEGLKSSALKKMDETVEKESIINSRLMEVEENRKQSVENRKASEHTLSEIKSVLKIHESKLKSLDAESDKISRKKEEVELLLLKLDERQNEVSEINRQLAYDHTKVMSVREKLKRDLETAKISDEIKDSLKKELE